MSNYLLIYFLFIFFGPWYSQFAIPQVQVSGLIPLIFSLKKMVNYLQNIDFINPDK